MIDLEPLGENAWIARFPDEAHAAGWGAMVRQRAIPGVLDVITAYRSVAVLVDWEHHDPADIRAWLREIPLRIDETEPGRLHVIPTLYDGADLADVARVREIGIPEVIAAHSSREYRVFAVGFQPGFPYAGYLPETLSGLPRRDIPRTAVPAGSVAIAGRQTGIYPKSSPGGWHLLGRTPLCLVDVEDAYFPIRAGDRIRFEPIDEDAFRSLEDRRLP